MRCWILLCSGVLVVSLVGSEITWFCGSGSASVPPGERPSGTNSCAGIAAAAPSEARAPGRWPDGKRAAFMLSFDDGCPTQVKNVFPLLEKYRIPGTFYVCPGWDSFKAQERDWADAGEFVVLGNHTYTHGKIPDKAALERELADCNAAIRRLRPNQKGPVSFAVPGAESMHDVLEIADDELAEAYRRNNLVERFPWHGYPVQCRTVKEMEEYVDSVLASGGVGHMDFHGVGGDWLDPGLDYFKALLEKLDSRRGDFWFTTHIELVRWLGSRNGGKHVAEGGGGSVPPRFDGKDPSR